MHAVELHACCKDVDSVFRAHLWWCHALKLISAPKLTQQVLDGAAEKEAAEQVERDYKAAEQAAKKEEEAKSTVQPDETVNTGQQTVLQVGMLPALLHYYYLY